MDYDKSTNQAIITVAQRSGADPRVAKPGEAKRSLAMLSEAQQSRSGPGLKNLGRDRLKK